MTIWNLGSINADFVYSVPHIPAPGETLSSTGRQMFLGGKGANMSVAVARAGSHVAHIGAVGPDGSWAIDRLTEYGVDTRHIAQVETETALAIVMVDEQGENAILLHPGANRAIPQNSVEQALTQAKTGETLVFQNETSQQLEAARLARSMDMRVVYAAAPFQVDAVMAIRDHIDMLILNQVEANQLQAATGLTPDTLPVEQVVVTAGAEGATWYAPSGPYHVPALPVHPVDTTGAGDTFTGYLLAGLDQGMPVEQAMQLASRAAALMVTRHGTADVIPDLAEVRAFQP